MRLGLIAHARAGDKGDTSILFLAPFDQDDFELIRKKLTPETVARHFGSEAARVTIIALEKLNAFTIVIQEQLGGGVTRTHRVDPHGKTLSSHLLDLEFT